MSDSSGTGRPSGLETEVQWLKGVGPRGAMLLAKLGIKCVGDVLRHYPRRMEDRRHLPPIAMLQAGTASSVRGHLQRVRTQSLRGGKTLISAVLEDETGAIDLIWFNQPWVSRELSKGEGEIIAFGTVKMGKNRLEMASPEWEFIDEDDEGEEFARLSPVYSSKEGIPQAIIRKAAASAIEHYLGAVKEPLPDWMREEFRLPKLAFALRAIHLPQDDREQSRARERLAFDEFLSLQLELQMRRREVQQEIGIAFPISHIGELASPSVTLFGGIDSTANRAGIWDQVGQMLPFTLTEAQKRVVGEIWRDMERPIPMNRLVQGDVGSGKTAVAACAILAAVRCGYQAALMAPTEILAEQHAMGLKRLFEPLGIPVVLLAGKLTAAQKRKALQQAESGEARICVGTHALVQEGVKFERLGLAVIDEQHRFGVLQRAALRGKGFGHPDVLVMTATPIPRTMTMAIYGDLDVSVIDELPPGRMPIRTHWKPPHQRDQVYANVRKLIAEGRQAYFVCPMIQENEKMQTQAAEELYERLRTQDFADYRVGLLHGQMKGVDKEEIMMKFRAKELDILVSTVVIEVGVDVPNATVMVIEDAFRFGLSQLHQLRGRVGRGKHQSYCILISEARSPESEQRLSIMVETSDGFRIAEEDLKIRGPGDVAGTRQSGQLSFKIADLIKDVAQLERARQAAILTLERDPDLSSPDHEALLEMVKARRSDSALIAIS
jgi:ATP-dependent DNA helicase RecG